jgi:hypothetical protein
MTRSPIPRLSLGVAAAAGVLAVIAAGCGGGSPSSVGTGGSSTTASTTRQTAALAFARCMRSHGVPNWPDPTSDGGFDKSKLRQLPIPPARIRAIEVAHCNIAIPGPQQYTITPADRVDYFKGAQCMRRHGFPDFPDPTFGNNTVTFNTPSNIDTNSPQARAAVGICAKLIPPGLPYSHSDSTSP